MRTFTFSFGSLCVPLIFAVGASAQQPAPEAGWTKKLFDTAPEKWQEYLEITKHLQGTIRHVVDMEVGHQKNQLKWEFVIKQNNRCASLERFQNKRDHFLPGGKAPPRDARVTPSWELFGYAPSYCFHLIRSSKDQPWTRSRVGRVKRLTDDERKDIREEIASILAEALCLVDIHLPSLVKSKAFSVTGVREIERQGKKLGEFQFSHAPEKKGSMSTTKLQGTMVLNPECYWCLVEYSVTVDDKNRETAKFEYRTTPGKIPVLERVAKVKETDKSTWWKSQETFDFSLPAELPGDDEFLLAGFGLPDSDFPVQPAPPVQPANKTRFGDLLPVLATGGFVLVAFLGVLGAVVLRRLKFRTPKLKQERASGAE